MRIGIFGGAFNPVHNGHLHLIDELSRLPMYPSLKPIDKMLIIPTANPPHRTGAEFACGEDRINMLSLALDNPKAEVSDIEFKLSGKSYTYNTLKALKKLYSDDELYLFMGSDQLLSFKSWYKYEKILGLAQVVGFSRSGEDNEAIRQFLIDNEELGIQAIVASPYEMSSTKIRETVKNGGDISGFVPQAVADYIKEHGLYV
jgi:nicotinate-nucleotide adenylyltransferase